MPWKNKSALYSTRYIKQTILPFAFPYPKHHSSYSLRLLIRKGFFPGLVHTMMSDGGMVRGDGTGSLVLPQRTFLLKVLYLDDSFLLHLLVMMDMVLGFGLDKCPELAEALLPWGNGLRQKATTYMFISLVSYNIVSHPLQRPRIIICPLYTFPQQLQIDERISWALVRSAHRHWK